MEDLLQQIIKETSGSSSNAAKYVQLRTVCKEVHDFLEAQQGSLRAPPHELRERCLAALKLALESKSSKLVSLAVVGFQKFLRDDRFHSRLECESESEWLSTQLLSAVSSLSAQTDDIQLDLLKVLLNMAVACTTSSTADNNETSPWSLSEPGIVLRVLAVCRCAHSRAASSAAVKTAARATAGQTLRAFCDHLADEESAVRANPYCSNLRPDGDEESGVAESAFDKVVIVLHQICEKLQQRQSASCKNNNPKDDSAHFNLECILALFSSLSPSASRATTLRNHLWQELCPTLLWLLGTPKTETTIGVADGQLASVKQSIKCPSMMTAVEIKTVYGICVELVRLVGLVGALRPMLESIFHRILLSTSAGQRFEALRTTKEIMRKSELLLNFGGPPLIIDKKTSCFTDLGLLKLAMDAFVECSDCSDLRVSHASVECIVALLDTLERICEGHKLDAVLVGRINEIYKDLESADYKGPMTYQTWEKLHSLVPPKQKHTDLESNYQNDAEKSLEDEPVIVKNVDNLDDNDNDGDDEDENVEAVAAGNIEATPQIERRESKVGRSVDSPLGFETDSSGSTEGPEEGYEDDDEHESLAVDGKSLSDDKNKAGAGDRRWKVPRTLHGEEDGRAEQERVAQLYETRDVYSKLERRNARHFVQTFREVLPAWLRIKSSIEADEHMQEFASNYCRGQLSLEDIQGASAHRMIINADGVYLAMYASLLLNLKLIVSGYYKEADHHPPMTEDEFVDDVHGSGVLVYLSADWLAELYQHVLSNDFLGSAGYDRSSSDNSALVNLLTDWEGTNGSHLLSDYYRLEKTAVNEDDELDVNAGRKFARRVLTAFWDDILVVLRAHLRDKHGFTLLSSNIGFIFGGIADGTSKLERKGAGDAIAASLEGLQKAARLSSILDLHSRCESVFSMLSAASCPPTTSAQPTPTRRRRLKASVLALGKRRPIRLHISHVLSMDVMLYRGLELGSHCPHCWKHVFRCCFYLAELEHSFFSRGISGATTAAVAAPKPSSSSSSLSNVTSRRLGFLSMHPNKPDDLDFNDDEASVSSISFPGNAPPLSVNELVKQNGSSVNAGGVLTEVQSARILCSLSQQVDRLFDDAAYKLNLKSLLSFLTELSVESQSVLFSKVESGGAATFGTSVSSSKNQTGSESKTTVVQCHHDYHGNTLLLHRLGDVMLKCVRSGRPLVHVMQAWSIVGLHLMEAACHGDQDVAKRAVVCIHDVVSALLGTQSELPYFHFNEALFKPFESLLCLELCDIDIQDQIISSICEFVEGSKTEIRSGWRPLFGALRAVRPHRATLLPPSPLNPATPTALTSGGDSFQIDAGNTNAHHLPVGRHIVLDVFDAFLNAESNALVFANAAVDCILCLLKHIQGSSDEESPAEDIGDSRIVKEGVRRTSSTSRSDLCLPSLKYIHTCCQTLASMHLMPNCPIFHASNRIQLGSETQFVDPVIPGYSHLVLYGRDDDDGEDYDDDDVNGAAGDESGKSNPQQSRIIEVLNVSAPTFCAITLDELERPSGILHVWCLILEGLVGAIANCPRRHQPDAVHALFSILKKIYELPGVEFGLYVVNHILLPMMQSWLRRSSKLQPRALSGFSTNFKQCCGQTTDLVVDYLTKLSDSGQLTNAAGGGNFLLYQLFLLMTECVAQPNESVSRLGCSCIRHVIVTSGPLLTFELWDVTVTALRRISDVSLFHVKQLMAAFKQDSDNFYGDLCQVKVAAKSDCSSQENERLQQLAQQVFLLDNQRLTSNGVLLDDPIDDDKSYMFLLYSTDSKFRDNVDQSVIIKVPFRSIVVGLVSHQLLLQTIGLLLSSASHVVPSLANILLQSPAQTPTSGGKHAIVGGNPELPGMMRFLSGEQVQSLMDCLKDSYDVSCQFDARPGLKFLVQKVARASAAANLYKQSGASWTLRAVTLLELCLHRCGRRSTKNKPTDRSNEPAAPKFLDFCFDDLRATFDEACAAYVEHFAVAKRGEEEDRFARLQDQPIFFLIAHDVEDYMEARQRGGGGDDERKTSVDSSAVSERPSPREEHGESEFPQDEKSSVKSVESLQPPETGRDALDEFNDGSDDESESADEGKTRVFEVATQKDIDSMVNEYKKRKQQCSMPPPSSSSSCLADRKRSFSKGVKRRPEREETKLASVLKDHQACIKVRTEMLLSMFDFFCQVDDVQFEALLAEITFPFVRTLVAHANDSTLRQSLAEFLDRIARIYGFTSTGVSSSLKAHSPPQQIYS